MATSSAWRSGEVLSADGTSIGYRRYGTTGPGVVLVHGGGQAAQNLHRLAVALADSYVVWVPDRRGRGRSGPPGDRYGLATERDDLAALVERGGAVHLFGLSSGGIIALSAARTLPGIHSAAVYEPPLSVNHSTPLGWLPRYQRELARGDVAGAAVTAIRGIRTASLAVRLVPRPLLTVAMRAGMRAESRTIRESTVDRVEDVPMRELVPTMQYDARLIAESEGTLPEYATLKLPVLLLGGRGSVGYLSGSLGALQRVLPNAMRVELAGVGHTAPDNTGQPERVATELRRFWDRCAGTMALAA